MPLIDFDHGGQIVTDVPFKQKYKQYLRKLAAKIHPKAIDTAKQAFHAELHDGIVTTSWVPGADWRGTAYQSLYDAVNDPQEAAKFFGLVACECVLERCFECDEDWGYGHYKKDDIPIKGRTYFRLDARRNVA